MNKRVGILGGMGPLATLDFVHKIIANTPAQEDQQHLELLIYNNPKIPSRIKAFTPGQRSPLPELIRSAQVLEKAGVDFLMMPCHSAHYWLDEIRAAISIPFYSIVSCTVEAVLQDNHVDHVLLVATETTLRSQLYQSAFESSSVHLILPSTEDQEKINQVILAVKSNYPSSSSLSRIASNMNCVVEKYKARGVTTVIAGCTEIPLLFNELDQGVTYIDPTLLLARDAISLAF